MGTLSFGVFGSSDTSPHKQRDAVKVSPVPITVLMQNSGVEASKFVTTSRTLWDQMSMMFLQEIGGKRKTKKPLSPEVLHMSQFRIFCMHNELHNREYLLAPKLLQPSAPAMY